MDPKIIKIAKADSRWVFEVGTCRGHKPIIDQSYGAVFFTDSSHRDLSASNFPGLIQWICDPVIPEILANWTSPTSSFFRKVYKTRLKMKLIKNTSRKIVKTKVVGFIELRIFQPVALRNQLSKHTLWSNYFSIQFFTSRFEALVKICFRVFFCVIEIALEKTDKHL